jgi:hypothetical protein
MVKHSPLQQTRIIRGNLRTLLLIAQGFDRIERGGFARWIKPEEDADGSAE